MPWCNVKPGLRASSTVAPETLDGIRGNGDKCSSPQRENFFMALGWSCWAAAWNGMSFQERQVHTEWINLECRICNYSDFLKRKDLWALQVVYLCSCSRRRKVFVGQEEFQNNY